MESWIVDKYLDSDFQLPGFLVQAVLNSYLGLYERYDRLAGVETTTEPPASEEIAEKSAELMATHYNMPLALFRYFLGPTMKYSMALWENGTRTLEEAQEAMMADVCEKVGIEEGQKVLDIGCGFGSLAAYVLKHYPNTKVYGLTLSQTQADYMRARQAEPGHPLATDRFFLIQEDFNKVRFDNQFDRVVSLGVFEHISNLGKALQKIRSFMNPQGLCLLHYIVFRPVNERLSLPRQNTFIARYIFPGGRIWSNRELYKHQDHLKIEQDWFLNGSNYRRTLEAWLDNFHRNLNLLKQESGLSRRQLKIWDFYLRATQSVFRVEKGTFYGNGQYLLRPS